MLMAWMALCADVPLRNYSLTHSLSPLCSKYQSVYCKDPNEASERPVAVGKCAVSNGVDAANCCSGGFTRPEPYCCRVETIAACSQLAHTTRTTYVVTITTAVNGRLTWKPSVWLSTNTLVSINVLTPQSTPRRSVPGCHLGAEPGTHVYSTWAIPPWVNEIEYPAKAAWVNRHIAWYTSPYPWSCSVGWCLADGYVEISADVREAVAH